jgi:hypothetical protein
MIRYFPFFSNLQWCEQVQGRKLGGIKLPHELDLIEALPRMHSSFGAAVFSSQRTLSILDFFNGSVHSFGKQFGRLPSLRNLTSWCIGCVCPWCRQSRAKILCQWEVTVTVSNQYSSCTLTDSVSELKLNFTSNGQAWQKKLKRKIWMARLTKRV